MLQQFAPAFAQTPDNTGAPAVHKETISITENRPAPSATPPSDDGASDFYSHLDDLNRKILLKDVELERFNITFRKANNVQGRWRGPRYFLSQETNAVATASGVWASVVIRSAPLLGKYYLALNSKGHIVQKRKLPFRIGLEEALIPQMIGPSIGTLGSTCELGVNIFHDYQAHKMGLDPVSANKRVEAIKKEIVDLTSKRNALIKAGEGTIPQSHLQLAVAQGQILQDLCNLALNEYAKFHVGTRRYRGFQDSIYILDIVKNMIGLSGTIVADYPATIAHRGAANAPAGVLGLVSGAFIIASPVIARLIGRAVASHAQHRLSGLVEGNESYDLAKLESDLARLRPLMHAAEQSDPAPALYFTRTEQIQSLNELSTESHRKKYEMSQREIRAGTRAATENIATGTVVGGTKIMSGLGYMIAGFRFYHNPIDSNFDILDGGITYGVGSTIGAADNLRIQLRSELQRRKLMKNHLLPGQIFADHLERLKEIERRLTTNSQDKAPTM